MKLIRTIATVATIAGLAIVTGGAAAGLGISLATSISGAGITAGALLAGASALSIGASLLYRPKAPALSEASTDRLTANIDPRTPRKFCFGKSAMLVEVRL